MAYFLKKKAHVISRGEGKNTVAIALSQADPLIETVSVFLSSTLYTLDTYVYAKYIIRGFYPYSVSLYSIEFSLHNCAWHIILAPLSERCVRSLLISTFDRNKSWASPAILKIAFVMKRQRQHLMRRLFCVLVTDSTTNAARNPVIKQH